MTDAELVRALKTMSIETGGIICLGCGHEHGCGVHGCAVLKEAAKRIMEAAKVNRSEIPNGSEKPNN